MRVRVLGRCEVEVAGKMVALRRKQAELVGLLAVRRGAASRAEIATTLWPDALDADARHNLRQTLVALRERLGEAVLSIEGDGLALDPRADVDLWRRHLGDLDPEGLAETEAFLPGATAEWVLAARADLDRRIVDAALRAGEAALGDNPLRALDYARVATARDAEMESARALAVRACLAVADCAGATREIEAFEAAVARLVGEVTPSRLRALLEPALPLDLGGLDLALLGGPQRLRLVTAAVPALRGGAGAARSALEAALADAEGASIDDRSLAEVALANLAISVGDMIAAEALAGRAGRMGASEAVWAAAEVVRARVLTRQNRFDEAWAASVAAQASAERQRDSAVQSAAVRLQGTILLYRHRVAEAEARFWKSEALARIAGDRNLLAEARHNVAVALFYAGRVDAALETAESALTEAPRALQAQLRMCVGRMREAKGHWNEAREAYNAAVERLRAGGDPYLLAQALTYVGDLAVRRGELEPARRAYVEAIALRRTVGDRLGLMTAYKGLGIVAHRAGRLRSAARHLREALRFSLETGEPMAGANARTALARVLADAGNREEALREARRARRGILALRAEVSALTVDDTLSLEAVDALIATLEPVERQDRG